MPGESSQKLKIKGKKRGRGNELEGKGWEPSVVARGGQAGHRQLRDWAGLGRGCGERERRGQFGFWLGQLVDGGAWKGSRYGKKKVTSE